MNKILIVIGREFNTRVRKKSFLILTLAVPVFFTALYAFLMWIFLKDDTKERRIAVVNRSAIETPLRKINNTTFDYTETRVTETSASEFLQKNDYYAVVRIPENVMDRAEIPIYSFSQIPMELKNEIEEQVKTRIEELKRKKVLAETRLPDLEEKLQATRTPVLVRTLKISEETGAVKESSSEITSAIGLAAGLVIYLFIVMYASQVMRGVIEEKTNRIIEVVVSSVRPFQFLMGKIIGVAAVGLLQFLIWIVFGLALLVSIQFFLPGADPDALRNAGTLASGSGMGNLSSAETDVIRQIAMTVNPAFIVKFLCSFLFYFLGGYLLYASLFAALGAAADNETDSQQFLAPLSIILMIGFYIGLAAVRNPESSLAFWSSFIPFTSPVVMLVRIPFGVPGWEVLVSMLLLVAAFLFFTWLSGKIYRVGILMYGKKASWKELYKWLKY